MQYAGYAQIFAQKKRPDLTPEVRTALIQNYAAMFPGALFVRNTDQPGSSGKIKYRLPNVNEEHFLSFISDVHNVAFAEETARLRGRVEELEAALSNRGFRGVSLKVSGVSRYFETPDSIQSVLDDLIGKTGKLIVECAQSAAERKSLQKRISDLELENADLDAKLRMLVKNSSITPDHFDTVKQINRIKAGCRFDTSLTMKQVLEQSGLSDAEVKRIKKIRSESNKKARLNSLYDPEEAAKEMTRDFIEENT